MDRDVCMSRRRRCRRCLWIILLLLLLQPLPANARQSHSTVVRSPISISAPLLADGWSWRTLFAPVQSALGNRRRMIQFATIGMCLGLYILMRK